MLLEVFERTHSSLYAHLYDFAKRFSKRGHEIHVITRAFPGQLEEEHVEKIQVHRLNVLNGLLGNVQFFLGLLFKTILIIRKYKIDLVYSHIQGWLGAITVIGGKLTNRPTVFWHCGLSEKFSIIDFQHRPMIEVITGLLFQFTLQRITRLITCSEATKMRYVELFNIPSSKIKIIPNFVDIERFKQHDRDIIKQEYGIHNSAIVLYVGAITAAAKGIIYLLKAIPLILKNHPNTYFILVGGSHFDKESLEARKKTSRYMLKFQRLIQRLDVANNVIFAGPKPNDEIPLYLAASDLLVLPSIREGFGRVLIEAMACEKPVVASYVGGIPEIVKDCGILVEPKNIVELANAILTLLKNNALAKEFGKRGLRNVLEKYTLDKIVIEFEKSFLSLLNKNENN